MRFRSKIYGAVTVGKRGQVVIPAKLRKSFNLMPEKYFSRFLGKGEDKIYRNF